MSFVLTFQDMTSISSGMQGAIWNAIPWDEESQWWAVEPYDDATHWIFPFPHKLLARWAALRQCHGGEQQQRQHLSKPDEGHSRGTGD